MRPFLALLQASWLALLIAEPAALHACAMHSSGHGTHTTAVVATQAANEAADDHAHHHAAAEAASVPTDDLSDAPCQCLGECCAAAVAALPATSLEPASVGRVAVVPAETHVAVAALRAPDLQLPYANAPPGPLTT
jgi:hypothetical protein